MDIDRVKENIQPLRGGRNPAQLGAALQPDAQRLLQAQRLERETAAREYTGPDPLEPWFEYVQWIEQSYPKRGHEGQIDKLIKECLSKFETDDRYKQDRRYLRLWIKFIDSSNNPLELYQLLYSRGIGTTCSELYRAWAMYCEEADDFPKAEEVYNLGFQANAQPESELQQAHMAFQICFAQRMLHDDSPTKRKAASALAETRLALTSLRAVKRRNVVTAPTQRTGDAVYRHIPGTLRQNPETSDRPRSNIMINVYDENPGPSSFPAGYEVHEDTADPPASLLQSCAGVENQKEVGIWTSSKTEKLSVKNGTVIAPAFSLYEDDNLKLSANHLPHCLDDFSTFKIPMFFPDPPDPNKISMYNKKEVYKELENGEVVEFSLEQIKARKYRSKNNFKIEETNSQVSVPDNCNNIANDTNTKNNPNLESNSQYNEGSPILINSEFNLEKVITETDSLLNTEDPNALIILEHCDNNYIVSDNKQLYNNGEKTEMKENDEASPNEHYAPLTNVDDYANPGIQKNIVVDFDRSLMSNLNNESMTINTKAAHQSLNLFNESVHDISVPVINHIEPLQFDIREDHSMTMAAVQVKSANRAKIEIFEQAGDENAFNEQPINPQKMYNLDDETSTQIFSFNVQSSSTPYSNNFKKPQFMDSVKKSTIRSFNPADCGNSSDKPQIPLKQLENGVQMHTNKSENIGGADGLYPIMETTQEYRSGSSSSGSNFTTRNTLYGYAGRESSVIPSQMVSEKTQDSNVHQEQSYQQYNDANMYGKKSFNQKVPSVNHGQRNFNYSNTNENPMHPSMSPNSVNQPIHQYHTTDHQYHKVPANNYSRYNNAQRGANQYYPNCNQPLPNQMNSGYQSVQYQNIPQNSNYVSPDYQTVMHQNAPIDYPNAGYQSPQQSIHSPSPHAIFQSPPHVPQGYQSPQQNMVQHGFQSPQQNMIQQGFQSPQQDYMSPHHEQAAPQHVYANSQQNFASPQYYPDSQPSYHNQSQQIHNQVSQVGYQNPVHPSPGYSNANPYNSPSQYANVQSSQMYPQSSPYASSNNQLLNHSYQNRESYPGPNHSQYMPNQQYNIQNENQARISQNNSYSYHSAHNSMNSQYNNVNTTHDNMVDQQMGMHNLQAKPNISQNKMLHKQAINNSHQYLQNNIDPHKQVHQSSTSKLRSVRHEVPHHVNMKGNNYSSPDASNQYLNYMPAFNQPKDNANTPKFTNSPNISQKMHKNLYVSSPEQAQMPPNTELSHIDISKEGTLRMLLSSNILIHEKFKDVSKRQLDFEQRSDAQSEDSRDSMGKSKHSIKSYYGESQQMDVDSESSMDCQNLTFRSNYSNSLISSEDIPKPATVEFPKIIDPFNTDLCNSLLQYVKFPNKTHIRGYYELRSVPKLQQGTVININQQKFSVEKQLGKGAFGSVFRGSDLFNQEPVALKYQKPGHPWEYYICQEIKARIKDPFMLPGYMDIRFGFFGDSASIFVSELSLYGSLLDVANRIKAATTKCIGEFIVMLLASEMLSIIHHLHKSQIIHADIKPDNFLVMKIPQTESRAPSLQLIDYGCAIDMSLFPEGTTFKKVISTDGFTCTEMRDGRPWTYQTDLYCLAGTVYVILMGNYMQTAHRGGQWVVEKKWPRYMKSAVWDKVFTTLLNVKDCTNIPNLLDIKDSLDEFLRSEDANMLAGQLRNFEHVLKCK